MTLISLHFKARLPLILLSLKSSDCFDVVSVHLKNIVILIFSNPVNGKQAAVDAGNAGNTVLFYL